MVKYKYIIQQNVVYLKKGEVIAWDKMYLMKLIYFWEEVKKIMSKAAMAWIMGCDPRNVKRYLEGYEPKKKRKV